MIRNDDLFALLKDYDASWEIQSNDDTGAVLVNTVTGSLVYGDTLNAALLTALWIYRNIEEV